MPEVLFDERAADGTAGILSFRLPARSVGNRGEGLAFELSIKKQNCDATDNLLNFWHVGSMDSSRLPLSEPGEEGFQLLAEQWRRETGMYSSVSKMVIHPAYQRIIGMGPRAIIPILRELQTRPDHWFWALTYITGENPVPKESMGNVRAMSQAWIDWGKRRGYIS